MLQLGDARLALVPPDAEPWDQAIWIFGREPGHVFVGGAAPGIADTVVGDAGPVEHGDNVGMAHRPFHVDFAELQGQPGQADRRLRFVEFFQAHADLGGPAWRHQLRIALLVEPAPGLDQPDCVLDRFLGRRVAFEVDDVHGSRAPDFSWRSA